MSAEIIPEYYPKPEIVSDPEQMLAAELANIMEITDEESLQRRRALQDITQNLAATSLGIVSTTGYQQVYPLADWYLCGNSGDPLPQGYAYAYSEAKSSSLEPAVIVAKRSTSEPGQISAASISGTLGRDVISKLCVPGEEREEKIIGAVERYLLSSPAAVFLSSLEDDTKTERPLSPFWKQIRTSAVESDVLSRFHIPDGVGLTKGTLPEIERRRSLKQLDDETMPSRGGNDQTAKQKLQRCFIKAVAQEFGHAVDRASFHMEYRPVLGGIQHDYEIRTTQYRTDEFGDAYEYTLRHSYIGELLYDWLGIENGTNPAVIKSINTSMLERAGVMILRGKSVADALSSSASIVAQRNYAQLLINGSLFADKAPEAEKLYTMAWIRQSEGANLLDAEVEYVKNKRSYGTNLSVSTGEVVSKETIETLEKRTSGIVDYVDKKLSRTPSGDPRLIVSVQATEHPTKASEKANLILDLPHYSANDNREPYVPGYTLISVKEHKFSFRYNEHEDPYQECTTKIPGTKLPQVAEWYRQIGMHALADLTLSRQVQTVDDLINAIRVNSAYTFESSNSFWTDSRDGKSVLNYESAVDENGIYNTQCTGASLLLSESLNLIYGNDNVKPSRTITGLVLPNHWPGKRVTDLGHAQVLFHDGQKLYILDSTPPSDEVSISARTGRKQRKSQERSTVRFVMPQMSRSRHKEGTNSETNTPTTALALPPIPTTTPAGLNAENLEEKAMRIQKEIEFFATNYLGALSVQEMYKQIVKLPEHHPLRQILSIARTVKKPESAQKNTDLIRFLKVIETAEDADLAKKKLQRVRPIARSLMTFAERIQTTMP